MADADRQALNDLYKCCGGDRWETKWDLEKDMSDWNGVTLNDEGRVVELVLNGQGLTGGNDITMIMFFSYCCLLLKVLYFVLLLFLFLCG